MFKKLSAPVPDPAAIVAAARLADPTSPPAKIKPAVAPDASAADPSVGLNIRVRLSSSDAIADRAQSRGISMKAVVMEALAAAGIPIAPVDLEDRTPARRKGL